MATNPKGKAKRGPCFETDHSSCSIPTKIKKWGAHRSDLQTVTITCIGSNKRKPSTSDFSEVKYKPVGTGKECRAAIKIYNNCSLSEMGILNKDRMLHKALKPLKEQIQLLNCLFEGDDDSWDIYGSSDILEMSAVGLPRIILRAFLFGMDDSNGKEAMRSLVAEILTMLKLDTLECIQTGSTSRMTCFATSTILQNLLKDSSSSDAFPKEDSQSSPEDKQQATLVTPVSHHARRDNQVSPLSESSSSHLKSHLSTSDVLVFYQPLLFDTPIETKLVICVKKGCKDGMPDLVRELLSRLPYQSGCIFGLHINAFEATICSVQHGLNGEDPSDTLNLCVYTPYTFKKPEQPFCVESFWNMILDIGSILLLNPPE